MRLVRYLLNRFSNWLLKETAASYNDRGLYQIGPGSVLCPEASIENTFGVSDRISLGSNTYCRGRLFTFGHGGSIKIGDWCYIGVRTEIWSMNSISIGDRVLIAHDVNIHDGTSHSLDPDERHKHFRDIVERGHPRSEKELPGISSSPVIIEDDVWIGFGVTIMKGVKIGKGSVISARSIVTEDVASYVVYRNEISPITKPLRINKKYLEN